MQESLNNWLAHPLVGAVVALALAAMSYAAWRQFRDRSRRRYYRERERQRREYWGWE